MQFSKILVATVFSFVLFAQCTNKINETKAPLSANSDCPLELFLSLGGLPKPTMTYLKENDIQKLFFINGGHIGGRKDYLVKEDVLRKRIEKIIPDVEAVGTGVLDWEGKGYKMLSTLEADNPELKEVEEEFIKAYSIAKELRPNIRWGFYGFPFRDYWNRNEKWIAKNDKLKKILSITDVIMPSVYDFYQDSNKFVGRKQDSLYVNDNITLALQYGKEFNKPVLPFYWHRWHNSNKEVPLKLIPWEEFGDAIIAGLEANYQGKKIAGIVWWGSDQYFYNVKNRNVVAEVSKEKDFETYQHKLIVNYSSNIKDLFKNYCIN